MEGRRSFPSLRARVSFALVLTVFALVMVGLQPAAGAAPAEAVQAPAAPTAAAADADDVAAELAVTGPSDSTPWIVIGSLLAMVIGAGLVFLTSQPAPVLVEMRSLRPIEPLNPAAPPAPRRRRRR